MIKGGGVFYVLPERAAVVLRIRHTEVQQTRRHLLQSPLPRPRAAIGLALVLHANSHAPILLSPQELPGFYFFAFVKRHGSRSHALAVHGLGDFCRYASRTTIRTHHGSALPAPSRARSKRRVPLYFARGIRTPVQPFLPFHLLQALQQPEGVKSILPAGPKPACMVLPLPSPARQVTRRTSAAPLQGFLCRGTPPGDV